MWRQKVAKNQAPPQAQQAPKPDLKLQPKSEASGRQPNTNRSNPQSEPRKPESEKKAQRVSEPPAKEKPGASEKNESNKADKDHGNKGKD